MDDQSSVAGREDTTRDQTVSSPLHPSAPHARPLPPVPPEAAHLTHEPKSKPTAAALSQGGVAGEERGALWEASPQGRIPGQGCGRGPEGRAAGSLQGSGKGMGMGPTKGQRPSTAPVSPVAGPGKILKPTRCQKCHTCRHKQLKKQCLRNKASFLSSPVSSPLQPNPLVTVCTPPPPPDHPCVHHFITPPATQRCAAPCKTPSNVADPTPARPFHHPDITSAPPPPPLPLTSTPALPLHHICITPAQLCSSLAFFFNTLKSPCCTKCITAELLPKPLLLDTRQSAAGMCLDRILSWQKNFPERNCRPKHCIT